MLLYECIKIGYMIKMKLLREMKILAITANDVASSKLFMMGGILSTEIQLCDKG